LNKASVRQFILYSLIGILNTGIHFGVFVILYRWLGVPVLAASAIGYCAGLANSYFMNRAWTFAVPMRAHPAEFLKFLVVNLVALSLNLLTLHVLADGMGLLPELAQAVAILFSLVANFAGNKWWAFRHPKAMRQAE